MAQQTLLGQDLLIIEASRPHSDTQHPVGLLWTSDQPHTDLYLTTHNTLTRQTPMHRAAFEPAIPVSERPQTHVLDRAATGIGSNI